MEVYKIPETTLLSSLVHTNIYTKLVSTLLNS